MLTTGEFGEVVGMVYDCALDPDRWSDALERIAGALCFRNASLSLLDLRAGTMPLSITSGIEEPWLSRMGDYAAEIMEQWGGFERLQSYPLEEPVVLTWINPEAASERNRYYVEWSRPQKLIDVLAIGLTRDTQMFGTLGLGRHESAGPVRQREVDAARLLAPHLQRAVTISRLLDLRRVTATSFEGILQRLSTPVFIASADCRVQWLNPAAEDLVGAGEALTLRDGRLTLRGQAAQGALARAVGRFAGVARAGAGGGCDVPIQTEDGRALSLYVLPLGTAAPGSAGGLTAILAGPPRQQRDPCETVGSLFGLTPSERRVLSCLADGGSIPEIAARLGIGRATVRTHMLRIFDKTGVHRQTELVALLGALTVPVRSDNASAML